MSGSASSTAPKHSSQQGLVLWHGMRLKELWELAQIQPELHWSRFNRWGTLPLTACYNSLMGALEQMYYGRQVEQTQLVGPPVFILGFWRSGTTLLHGLLDRDPQFTSPSMYRTLFPWHFLLTERAVSRATAWMMPKSRPMDNVPLSWDTPQEDDLALCIMSLISPYLLLAAPSRLNLHWESLDFSRLSPSTVQRWKEALLLLLKKITLRDRCQVVLKSPSHTFRIPTLLEMFPDAKFIYIYRNPYNVFRSTVHLRRTMVEENGLGLPVCNQIEEEIIRCYRVGFEAYEQDKRLIPAGNLHEVRFESLEQDPVREMEQLYRNLQFNGFDALHEALLPELAKLKHYKKNSFKQDAQWMQRVSEELAPAFQRFGYPSPFEELETVAA